MQNNALHRSASCVALHWLQFISLHFAELAARLAFTLLRRIFRRRDDKRFRFITQTGFTGRINEISNYNSRSEPVATDDKLLSFRGHICELRGTCKNYKRIATIFSMTSKTRRTICGFHLLQNVFAARFVRTPNICRKYRCNFGRFVNRVKKKRIVRKYCGLKFAKQSNCNVNVVNYELKIDCTQYKSINVA